MLEIASLKDFMDLGGVFILALVLVMQLSKKLDQMNTNQIKVMSLLAVLTKTSINHGTVEKILKEDASSAQRTAFEHNPEGAVPLVGATRASVLTQP